MKNDNLGCWYAIRTFNCKELEISKFLTEKGLTNFVPMAYAEKFEKANEKPKKILVPVIHNYLFLQKTIPELEVMKKDGSNEYCEISESEMAEFRLLCDPNFESSVFMKADEAEAKPGKNVVIIHGPFSGVHGKLHRVHND